MTNNQVIALWNEVLEEYAHCYADENGDRPCDLGENCTKCREYRIQDMFRQALTERELSV